MSDRQIELSAPTSGVESGHSGSTISTRSALSAATHGVPLGANVPSTPSGGPTCTFTDHKISRSCGTDLEQDQPLMESMDKEEEEDFRSVNEDDDGEDQREGGGESEDEDESEDWYLGESEGWYEDESEDDESEDDEGLPSPSSNTTSESSFSLWNGYLRPGEGHIDGEDLHISTQRNARLVQSILAHFFALELVQIILDEAEYWPVLSCTSGVLTKRIVAAQVCYYISPRLPSPTHGILFKVRKVVFRLWSHDQGWTPEWDRPGQYTESKTHFEATIIRDLGGGKIAAGNRSDKVGSRIQDPMTPSASGSSTSTERHGASYVPNPCSGSKFWHLQRNIRASSFEALHEISWTDEDDPEKKIDTEQVLDETGKGGGYGYVRHLAPGDRIAIHATALPSPGWANHVRAVEIRSQAPQLMPPGNLTSPMSGLTTNNTGITESPSGARYGATDGPTLGNLSSQFHSLYIDNDDERQQVLGRDSSAQSMTNTEIQPIALCTQSSANYSSNSSSNFQPPQFSGSAQGQSSMDDDNTNEGAEEEEGDFPDEEPESGENAGEEGWATTEDDETDSDGEDDSDDESDSSQDESEEETTDENGDVYEGYHKDDQLPEFSIGGPPMNPLDHPRAPEHSCPFWTEQEIEPLIPGKAHPHIPTSVEVKRVQDMLSIFFATELVKLILDEAGYWPTLTCSTGASLRKVEAWYNPTLTRYRATYCYYITPRLPSPTDGVLFKVRKIVFRLCSHDQGWTTDAIKSPELAYWGAKTWFEAAIIRGLPGEEPIAHPDDVARRINGVSTQRESNAEPSALDNATPDEAFQVPNPWRSDSKIWHLQRNVRAEWAESLHEVTWTDEDDPDKKENTKENLDLRGRGGAMGSSVSCNQGTGSPFTLELGMVAG